jgi:excinuclease ABC subunit A
VQVMHRLRDAAIHSWSSEHDPQIMLAGDRPAGPGPGAGERGGEIVAFDTPEAVRANPRSLTGQYLSVRNWLRRVAPTTPKQAANCARLMVPARRVIRLTAGSRAQPQEHRRGVFRCAPVCITGVSGSGKSTLIEDVLHKAMLKALGRRARCPAPSSGCKGAEPGR